jgi:signal transduction histidine kinase
LNRASRLPAEDLETSLSEAQSLITELMKKIRQLSLDLSPTILDNLGLLPTLNWYFNRFAKQTNIFVKFDHRGLQRTFAPQINITVYRIIQEALTNVARYASVNEVTINISVGKGIMDIMVEDKGKGFKTDSEDAHSSYGLSSMRERARALGGMLFIDSYPGVGTCIKAKLPLKGKYKRKKKAI